MQNYQQNRRKKVLYKKNIEGRLSVDSLALFLVSNLPVDAKSIHIHCVASYYTIQ